MFSLAVLVIGNLTLAALGQKQEEQRKDASFLPVVPKTEPFLQLMKRMEADKPAIEAKQKALLNERYDLADHPATGVAMSNGKPVQSGIRIKLANGLSWEKLGQMTPEAIREQNAFPAGFLPLPHPFQQEGGQIFPQNQIDEIKKQEGRDLTRFDIDFDLPAQFLPEFPAPIYLTTRPDLGDVSKGQLITSQNYFEIFNGILTPQQLDGLRLLVTPFAQQQFNLTDDRRSAHPTFGVTCFDCHANGHTNGAIHLDPSVRPQEFRHRLDVPTLRGVQIQRLFGSQRSLRSVEDFTEFEQRTAYFDGDPVTATKKGVNILSRGDQVANMAAFQSILDFPPAPKLDKEGKLDPAKASPSELAGQALFFGKAKCSTCHQPPFYTDNEMHDLQIQRFFALRTVNGRKETAEGPIKTFPLRGIKDSPPYLHDGRLLTLEDSVEFFNLVLQTRLTAQEKADLVAFMRAL
jgi:cytochrome c peroxidase